MNHHFLDPSSLEFPLFLSYNVFDNPALPFDVDAIFGEIGALIWVNDAQDDYLEAVQSHASMPLSSIYNIQRDITIRIQDELSDQGVENAPVYFHLTSSSDHWMLSPLPVPLLTPAKYMELRTLGK
ncbi:hypothetical protein QBC32DRAFT_319388 [Pseudoneurospora amorphoporcata]|uniref:Uncharacterized protein n=1 Tax=Pseudoneurospora amorphoporcata TaxID=241081 RepID=A0AAN6SAF5_9PEZI|nr:hypothetical protein QBC32DRAFT_319388 [Pseudoneurospora amorphoporcata]